MFISTENYQFCVLKYDNETGKIITTTNGDIKDRVGKAADVGQLAAIEPQSRVVLLHLYDRLVKIIPIDSKGAFEAAYNLRIDELKVLDVKFLHGQKSPTFALLYQDAQDCRHLKTYQIADEQLIAGPFQAANLKNSASMVVPLPQPLGGVLIFSAENVVYKNFSQEKSVEYEATIIQA